MSVLPSEIVVTESSGEVCYYLPKRPPDAARRVVSAIIMALGGLIALMPILGVLFLFLQERVVTLGRVVVPLLVGGPFFLFGALMLFWGLHLLIGRTQIQIRSNKLRILYQCGRVGLPQSKKLKKIRFFRVGNDVEFQANDTNTKAEPDKETDLVAHMTNGKCFAVCVQYPRDWMLLLAEDLARRCQQLIDHDVTTPVKPILVEDARNPAPFQDRFQKPMNSTAIVDLRPEGLTITIPPPGPLKGSRRSFVSWCLIWNGFVLVMAPLFLRSAFLGKAGWEGTQEKVSFSFACLFVTPFVLIGLGSLLFLFLRGRRSTVITTTVNSLEIMDINFFASCPYQWDAKKLISISVIRELHEGQGEEGNYLIISLGIQSKDGSIDRFLSNRDPAELEWIATELRQSLRLPATAV